MEGMRKNRGFSLVETMVAVVIIAVVMLALGMLLVNNMRANQASEQRMDAAKVSQEILADYAQRIMAGKLTCTVNTTCQFRGKVRGFDYLLTARNNGNNWALHVTLLSRTGGGQVKKYENEMFVNTVAGLNVQGAGGAAIAASGGGSSGSGSGAGSGAGAGSGSGTGSGTGAGGGGSGGGTTGGGTGTGTGTGGSGGGAGTGTGTGTGSSGGGSAGGGTGIGGQTRTAMNDGTAVVRQDSAVQITITLFDNGGQQVRQATLNQDTINTWLNDPQFRNGMNNKQGDVQRFTSCTVLGTPGVSASEIKQAFQQAATNGNTDWNRLDKALKEFNKAVKNWNQGKKKKAGKSLAKALKELAKAVGC